MLRGTRGTNSTRSSAREPGREQFKLSELRRDYDFVRKDRLDDDITFSRASGATQTNSSGLVAYAPHNLIPYSENFAHTDWIKYNASATASSEIDPFGGTGAYKFAEASTASNSKLMLDCFATSGSGTIYTWSVYAKKAELDILQLILTNVTYAGGDNHANFDLTNGVVTATGGGATAKIEAVGTEDWYRCSITDTTSASGETCPRIGLQNSGTAARDGAYAGNGTDGIFIFGAQGEKTINTDDSPTDYNKTSGSAYQGPRFDFTPIGNDNRGLLIEEARTNLDANSFAVGSLNLATSFAASNDTDPSGGYNSYKITPDTSSDYHYQYRIYNGLTNGATYTYSVYVKADGYSALILNTPVGNVNGNAGPRFDLTIAQQAAYFGTEAPASITECGNGWYRLSSTITTNATSLRLDHGIKPAPMDNAYSGDGSSGMLFWGSQLEAGSFPTSLIPTTGATATRAQDQATVSGTSFSRFHRDAKGGSWIVEAENLDLQTATSNQGGLFVYEAGDTFLLLGRGVGGGTVEKPAIWYKDGVAGGDMIYSPTFGGGQTVDPNASYKLGVALDVNNAAWTMNGHSVTTDTSVPSLYSPTDVRLSGHHGYEFNGHIRRIRYYNKRISNTKLERETNTDFLLNKYQHAKAAHSLRQLKDGADNTPVARVRRDYDSYEADYTANDISSGKLSDDHTSSKQTTLPLDVSCDASELVVGGDFTEMAVNGSMEADSDWIAFGEADTQERSTTQKHSGTYSWYIDGPSAHRLGIQSANNFSLTSGKKYTVSMWIYATDGTEIISGLNNTDQGVFTARAVTQNQWTHVTYTATASATGASYISALTSSSTANFYVDDVSVVEGAWTLGAGWTTGNGILSKDSTTGNADYAFPFKKGKTYDITFDVLSTSGGTTSVQARGNGSTVSQAVTLGANTFRYTDQTDHTTLRFSANAGVATIDNVSVKEVINANSASGFSTRKINSSYTGNAMRCRNQSNVEVEVGFDDNDEISLLSPITNTSQNLLAYSENFGQWGDSGSQGTKLTGGVSDPNGGNNAYLIEGANSANWSGRFQDVTGLSTDQQYTLSCYVKKGTSSLTRITLYDSNTSPNHQNIDIAWSASGVPSTSASTGATNINYEAVGTDGWYRASFVVTALNVDGGQSVIIQPDRNAANKSVYAYGAQLEETLYESTGTEKITNGTFDTDASGWTAQDSNISVAAVNGEAELTATDASSFVFQAFTTKVGAKYTLSADGRVGTGADSVKIQARDGTNGSYIEQSSSTTDGTVSLTFIALSTTSTIRLDVVDSSLPSKSYFDNVSALEYDPELSNYSQTPAIADDDSSTTATTLGGFSGLENLVLRSEDFSNAAWSKSNTTVALESSITSPTGGAVYKLTEDGSTSTHKVAQIVSVTAGIDYDWSIYVKPAGRTNIKFVVGDAAFGTDVGYDFVLTGDGSVGSVYNVPTDFSITSLDDGWYRVHVAKIPSSTAGGGFNLFLQSSAGTNSYAGDSSSGVYISSAQLNTNSLKTYQATTGTALTGDVNVVNWYDQNGGEDAVNAVAVNQPRIVKGSELVTSGGKAAIDFDGTNNLSIDSLVGSSRLDSFFVMESSDDTYVFPSGKTASSNRWGIEVKDGLGSTHQSSPHYGTPSYFVNGDIQSWSSSDEAHTALTGRKLSHHQNATTSTWLGYQVGFYYQNTSNTYNYTGKISEMVFFPNMDSSPKRFPIEQNMMNHFGVNLVKNGGFDADSDWTKHGDASINATTGLATIDGTSQTSSISQDSLVTGMTYTLTFDVSSDNGTGNRYSVNADGGGGVILNVTGNGSKSVTFTHSHASGWLYFTARNGGSFVVDNIVLKEHGVSGFVTKLYDQTGNNCHATQDTAALQCKLVSGGDVITSGGKPAWEYTANTIKMSIQGLTGIAHLDSLFVTDTSATKFMLANSANTYFMLSADSGATHSPLDSVGGSPTFRINGDAFSGHRGQAATELNGRNLLHMSSGATTSWDTYELGDSYYDSSWSYVGKMSETVFWDSDQSSNQAGIESNINTHYTIY